MEAITCSFEICPLGSLSCGRDDKLYATMSPLSVLTRVPSLRELAGTVGYKSTVV